MRLSQTERQTIVEKAHQAFGPDVRVFLFGSRVHDDRRGGDIDLLVRTDHELSDTLRRKIDFLVGVKDELGDQHIDVVVASPGDNRPVTQEALRMGVGL